MKDAINEAMRHCVATVADTYFLVSSTVAPHPFPTTVREFQSVVGEEALSQVCTASSRGQPSGTYFQLVILHLRPTCSTKIYNIFAVSHA